ncbi:MAG: AraC family transcriptional regulator [Alcanivorax sp.]|nr:AraC family transcriptional regulator [Alcanivorax sp.]MAY09101.1 AraC family transcriptional regulator [Alcanivorax sp.]MBI54797.1 AraC family transcriptional regulator [Alcanivorax sp.]HCE39014.1 AraC family transcriptional regulator [Alcanivorax sp.]|tara:strand:+ start:63966 stop:64811 length:846 start_codon:yes stop_codon:yes gene_type:complete
MPHADRTDNWVRFARDRDTGIETIHAHFEGHAYDPHWHDTYAVGVTEQGVQRFHVGRVRHESVPGRAILLEPGEIHDGNGPTPGGFTYRLLYLDPAWLRDALGSLFEEHPDHYELRFGATLSDDQTVARAIAGAFQALHGGEMRMVRQTALDHLLRRLTRHADWRARRCPDPGGIPLAQRARDYLHAHQTEDIGLDDLAAAVGTDRFRISRAFKAAHGLPPHAYLVQLRLLRARRLLAGGVSPADAAAAVGFADQSHLGRWFRRAYAMTPAYYRRRTKLPD